MNFDFRKYNDRAALTGVTPKIMRDYIHAAMWKIACITKSQIMKELKESYERRLKTVLAELKDCPLDIEKEARLETKAICYRTFIAELNLVLTI